MSATLVSGKLRLTYFGVRGSCDKVRLIMAQAGIEYQEEVVKGREFARLKHEFEFGQLPLLGILCLNLDAQHVALVVTASDRGWRAENCPRQCHHEASCPQSQSVWRK